MQALIWVHLPQQLFFNLKRKYYLLFKKSFLFEYLCIFFEHPLLGS